MLSKRHLLSLIAISAQIAVQTTAYAQAEGGPTQSNLKALSELLTAAQAAAMQSTDKAPQAAGAAPAYAPAGTPAGTASPSPGFRSVPVVGAPPASLQSKAAGDAAAFAEQPLVLKTIPTQLSLYVGQMVLIKATSISRVAVGSGKALEARVVDQRNLLVTALEAGESTLHIWDNAGRVSSVKVRINVRNLDRIFEEISQLTAGISGVRIMRIGEKIVLDGANLDPAAVARLSEIAQLYGPSVVSFATSERLRVDRMIEVQVRIVEFSKAALDDLGVRWDTSSSGFNFGLFSDLAHNSNFRIVPQGSIYSGMTNNNGDDFASQSFRRSRYYFGLSAALTSMINVQVQRGNAALLASPSLTTRSGGDAKFLSGGEIPLPAMSALGTGSVQYKPYGLRLDIKPIADGQGNISGQILAEVSNLDSSLAVNGIPGLLTRRTETEFNVVEGDTIVISGLLSRESSRVQDGLPGLRKLPLVGWAFKNQNDSDKMLETVVFLTPRVVTAKDSIPRIERARQIEDTVSERFKDMTELSGDAPSPASPAPARFPAQTGD